MTIKPVNRAQKAAKVSPDEFISKGGSTALEGNGDTKPDDEIRMTFRCPRDLVEKLDAFRKTRKGKLSRNQALVDALDAYLCEGEGS